MHKTSNKQISFKFKTVSNKLSIGWNDDLWRQALKTNTNKLLIFRVQTAPQFSFWKNDLEVNNPLDISLVFSALFA